MFSKISLVNFALWTKQLVIIGLLMLPLNGFTQTWNCVRKTAAGVNRPIYARLDAFRVAAINSLPAYTANFNSAMNKLCQSSLSDATLGAILDTLNQYPLARTRFLLDLDGVNNLPNQVGLWTINNSRSISNVILMDLLTANIVGAWKVCSDSLPNSRARLDWDLITTVATDRANRAIMDSLTLGTGQDLKNRYLTVLKNYAGHCNTCDTPKNLMLNYRMPYKHEYMGTLSNFTRIYSNRVGFKKFITGEATVEGNGVDKHDGAYHLMSDLITSNYVSANVVNFEDTISKYIPQTVPPIPYLCANCTYDVQLSGGILVDYKSYQISANPSVDQFKQYLQYWLPNPIANQRAVRSFQYVFNSKKLTLDQAKQKFLTLLRTAPADFYGINQTYFNQFTFIQNGTPTRINALNFATCLTTIDAAHPMFDFVIIKP
jgi:hypothetical protein